MRDTSISVIIPCFNEEEGIYSVVTGIKNYLEQRLSTFEIIIVNDGSTDGTAKELEKIRKDFIQTHIITNPLNQGKGDAVRAGVLASQYETVMFLDADLGIPIEELEKFVAELEKGFDLVVASRFVPGLKVTEPVLWHRRFMEKVFRFLRMTILGMYQVQDTQCGFKVFTRDLAMNIFPVMQVKRFAFDAEFIFLALKKGYSIKELPITLQNPSRSSVRIVRDSLNMLGDLIKIRVSFLNGDYQK